MSFEFDKEAHVYRLNGRRLPSVTEILAPLADYSMVPPDVLEAARVFGQHVHEACHLFDAGELDWDSLDIALVPYVEGWRNFILDSGAIVVASEFQVFDERLGYAGSPDKLLAWAGASVLPDLKVTAVVPPTVGAQTAAYARAYQRMHGGREPKRRCIHLLGDGKYKVHERRDPTDWSVFVSALNCHHFREKHRVAA